MGPASLVIHRALAWLEAGGASVRAALRGVAHHTGLPIVIVAAVVLVASWRILRHGLALAVEVAVAVALLSAATHLGWIRW